MCGLEGESAKGRGAGRERREDYRLLHLQQLHHTIRARTLFRLGWAGLKEPSQDERIKHIFFASARRYVPRPQSSGRPSRRPTTGTDPSLARFGDGRRRGLGGARQPLHISETIFLDFAEQVRLCLKPDEGRVRECPWEGVLQPVSVRSA